MNKLYLLVCLCCLSAAAHAADDDDTRRRLLQDSSRQLQQYRDSSWLDEDGQTEAALEADEGYIRIDGRLYAVGDSAEELESALYHAVNQQQWHKVAQFSERYRQLPQHKAALLDLGAGLQARARGDYRTAVAALARAAAKEPENTRMQLELARVYTEDNQNREAAAAFTRVLDGNLPEETRDVVRQYLREVDKRDDWHGQLSVGYGHNSNINQANGGRECVWQLADLCLAERILAQPVSSPVWQYSATAAKTLPVRGHHGLHLRAMGYGSHYLRRDPQLPQAPDHSQYATALYAGYDYANARTHLSLLPYFEHEYRNRHTAYRAWGADADMAYQWSPRWRVNARAGAKRFHYSGANRQYFADFSQYDAGVGAEFAINRHAGIYAQADYSRKVYADASASSRDHILRLGAYAVSAQGVYANLLLQQRRSIYDAPSFISDNRRRRDRQLTAVAALGLRNWQYKGIYPEVRFKRILAKSNSIYHSYRQNELLFNLRYQF